MAKSATPGVGAPDPELAHGQDDLPYVDADTDLDEPGGIAEPAAQEPDDSTPTAGADDATTARRSRKAEKEEPGKKPVNLDDLPEFRNWKAEQDRKAADMRKRMAELEREKFEREQQLQQQQMQQLAASLDEYADPAQKQAAIDQIAAVRGMTYARQWQQWAQHVTEQAQAAGLDPKDFDPMQYQGAEGRIQFERDLYARKAERLERERKQLEAQANPDAIAKIVQREVAKLAQQQGLNYAETGSPREGAPPDDEAWERDVQLVQTGRMSPDQYLKKWGK